MNSQINRRAFFLGLVPSVLTLLPPRLAYAQAEESIVVVIALKALEFAAGKIGESALGGVQIIDARTWVREAVAEIKAYVAGVISETVIDEMTASVDGIGENLKEYASLLPKNRAANAILVRDADLNTTKLIDICLKYDEAFTVSLAAMSYRLIARRALYRLDNDPGHILSLKSQVDNYFMSTISQFKKLQLRLAPGQRLGACCVNEMNVRWGCRPAADRNVIDATANLMVVKSSKDAALKIAAQAAHDLLFPSFNGIFQKFQSVSLAAIGSNLQTYSTMCASVGATYAPPVPIPVAVQDIVVGSPQYWSTKSDWKVCS